jgi:hypothetical protein
MNRNYVYSPSVSGLGGILAPMDMTTPDSEMGDLNYIGPLISTPDNITVSITDGGYGTSRAQYQARLSGAPNLGGGIADIAATFNMMDLFFGNRV